MRGHVTDEKGNYVKAAIVRLYKTCEDAGRQDPRDETDVITYAETDEEGRFLIRDLNPEEIYFIEIHIDHSVSRAAAAEPAMDPAAAESTAAEPAMDPDAEEETVAEDEELVTADGEPEFEEDDRIEDADIVDSLAAKTLNKSTVRETVCINCCCNYKTTGDLKSKPYLIKNNVW